MVADIEWPANLPATNQSVDVSASRQTKEAARRARSSVSMSFHANGGSRTLWGKRIATATETCGSSGRVGLGPATPHQRCGRQPAPPRARSRSSRAAVDLGMGVPFFPSDDDIGRCGQTGQAGVANDQSGFLGLGGRHGCAATGVTGPVAGFAAGVLSGPLDDVAVCYSPCCETAIACPACPPLNLARLSSCCHSSILHLCLLSSPSTVLLRCSAVPSCQAFPSSRAWTLPFYQFFTHTTRIPSVPGSALPFALPFPLLFPPRSTHHSILE